MEEEWDDDDGGEEAPDVGAMLRLMNVGVAGDDLLCPSGVAKTPSPAAWPPSRLSELYFAASQWSIDCKVIINSSAQLLYGLHIASAVEYSSCVDGEDHRLVQ